MKTWWRDFLCGLGWHKWDEPATVFAGEDEDRKCAHCGRWETD